jgi:EAL domain-containing protein (putative c-di-GMP-specific phosphodiesterase class I)
MQDRKFTDEELLERLTIGLEEDYIAPWFQPVMDPSGTIMISAEALPRFIDPEYGVISPMTFLEVASKHELLGPIGEVLLTKTCAAYAEWAERNIAPELVTINLAAAELQTDGVVERIQRALNKANIKPSNLGIEVVETVATDEGAEKALVAIDAFSALGVRVTVDDLGSGEVNPENLKKLHASTAKIDRMTVSQLGETDAAYDRVKALAEITKAMGIPLIAKGVETRVQIDLLVETGCSGQQGFAIARPMPLDSFTEWLDLNTGWDMSSTDAA